ncbi:hypothetical protein Fuma_02694 [Fuerstiella marisgermanici]|uniref:Uncharacterized protein n=1 Tax=Fuerstiella marisgermanici TaxID=1891926 RepID=A0A1P8WG96_9PLAN|nr:hypothetical protein Fuma_02694 [Fuerstiella marisgermanici]
MNFHQPPPTHIFQICSKLQEPRPLFRHYVRLCHQVPAFGIDRSDGSGEMAIWETHKKQAETPKSNNARRPGK